ncbi:MAG: HNH endonuclease [Xanthobacteraceae bacterium]|nr:HNH endonuclease [Xanthobacteraceae bacterium]
MSVRLIVAVTDGDWFDQLRQQPYLSEVNFWSPSATSFRALQPGELFLFKLHSPNNFVVGGGIFAHANAMPCSLAWEAFKEANGARSLSEMRTRIARYRRIRPDEREDFVIGCRVLTQPFFLERPQWLPPPESFALNTVTFKGYSTDEQEGRRLWEAVQPALAGVPVTRQFEIDDATQSRYGEPVLVRPRLGQGAFRILVTDTYRRRCAVSGERTLPALDAAHIRPFADEGSHEISNGILLRRDIHSLFDLGYVTITPEMKFEVSKKIREEYENGRHYYALQGTSIELPQDTHCHPDRSALNWHNIHRFKG